MTEPGKTSVAKQKAKTVSKRGKSKERGNSTGTVFKLPNGRYRWQVTLGFDQNHKQLRASGIEADKTKATKAAAKALSDHERGSLTTGGNVTLEDYATRWLEYQKNIAQTTRMGYQREINLVLEHLGRMKLREIRTFHIRDTLVRLADRISESGLGTGRVMSSRSLAHIRTLLRSIFRNAVSDGLISINPTETIKRIKVARTEHPGIALDFDQVAHFRKLGEVLYAAGACRLWFALFTAVSVGLRRGEVMGLRWRDIDFQNNLICVRQNLTSPGGEMVMRPTKTVAGWRDVLMPPSLKAALQRQQLEQHEELIAHRLQPDDDTPVFATLTGKYTHPDNLNNALNNILLWSHPDTKLKQKRKKKQLEMPKDEISTIPVQTTCQTVKVSKLTSLERRMKAIPRQYRVGLEAIIRGEKPLPTISPHDLRHTAGTLMLRRKVPIEVVSKTLGHADISITYRIYRHVLDSERREHVVDLFETFVPAHPAKNLPVN